MLDFHIFISKYRMIMLYNGFPHIYFQKQNDNEGLVGQVHYLKKAWCSRKFSSNSTPVLERQDESGQWKL